VTTARRGICRDGIAKESTMKLDPFTRAAALCGLVLGLAAPGGAWAADAPASVKDLVLKGDAVCTRCHDENESTPVLSIGRTRHGTVADGRAPTCTSCHGDSVRHVQNVRAPGETTRPRPDRVFAGKAPATSATERNAACTGCHQDSRRTHWQGSAHETRDVACTSCHKVHTQHDQVRDKATQPEVCFACHKEQRTQVSRASHHPVKEGKVACSDCHNPHGSAGVKLLVRDTVVDTCYTCHAEKRGPFVFNHQPVTEDCSHCHNPHGSTVANLLKSRPPFLCQQCHEPTSHRGNILGLLAGTGNAAGTRGIAQARSCLNCHTNIHGSNNPSNNAESRSLRR
jgi:DmsE family decaheme c-type cytochrome